MNYESQIKPLEAAGKTDAEIVVLLQADSRHVRDVPITEIMNLLLNVVPVLEWQPDGKWTGKLVEAVVATGNKDLQSGLNRLLGNAVVNPATVVRTNGDAKVGQLASALISLSRSVLPKDDAELLTTKMNEFTGGLLYANLTEQDIADSRTEYQRQQLQESLMPLREKVASAYNATVAAIDAGEATDAEAARTVFDRECV
jgi:hypothetical protein